MEQKNHETVWNTNHHGGLTGIPLKSRENDHETCDNSIGFCVRTLKHVRACTDTSSIHSHHKYKAGYKYRPGVNTYQGTVGMGRGSSGQYYGSPNNRGGLVGGSDAGTYRQ